MRSIPILLLVSLGGVITCTAQTPKAQWANEPKIWKESGNSLTETVPAGTDYWRITHYGFIRDSGPFRYEERSGNFEAKVKISGRYRELYHQAGLMVRIDDKNWIKTGIEFVNGKQNVSAVVTREFSDWSVLPRTDNPPYIWLRLQRYNDTVQISYSLDNEKWSMLRLAYFPPAVPVKVGMVAAAPGKEAFEVQFENFAVIALDSPPKED
jgi:regulation of enolase protein 1 (concanavalin A-like superfamily)